ncbi:MAG: UvrD-helicase domain-containing protein [Tannerella sp.]|jgi:ATP-dependent exoDNAse (exonuclease V) beta subunit|nr:UvrD-helicase domain-containing protein [Tannerella sp.]
MLTVYRASAGTGKTYTLTGEYVRLLFSGTDMHARILSVTFTNRATEEMKSRILKELHLLSSGEKSDCLGMLMDVYGSDEAHVRRRAGQILVRMLHDYASFNVSTIDHFFQQVVRAFIRELGLQGNYRIEMDVDAVLDEAIDSLLSSLDRTENKNLLGWLLRFSREKVERGESWDVRREIKLLSYELFKEKYKTSSAHVRKDIEDREALSGYGDMLRTIIRRAEAEARRTGEEAMHIMSKHGLSPSDFKGGSRSPMHFAARLARGAMDPPSATFRRIADGEDDPFAKTAPDDRQAAIRAAFEGGLGDCMQRILHFFDHLTDYRTAREIMRFYYTLGILSDLALQIGRLMNERNSMLIADTTDLLNRIVDSSDVPFIYEKTGTRIDHYMIDEFQDTSEMQWRNFRPLIAESLANRHDNLIVGDVKQSIYRFRNSDWTLLDEHVGRDFTAGLIAEKTLTGNWRSHRLIVEFNNAFFTVAPQLLRRQFDEAPDDGTHGSESRRTAAGKITSAYAGSYQHVAPPFRDRDGHVRIEFLPDGDETSWKEEAAARLPDLVERLQDNGYALRDIAILVRTRAEGTTVADTLLACKQTRTGSHYAYDIISDDALIIGNSPAVRFIAAMIRFAVHPDDDTLRKHALLLHLALRRTADPACSESPDTALRRGFQETTLAELDRLTHRPFYETAEGICRLFERDIPEEEQVFVQSFLDLIAGYAAREPADADKFDRWWHETGCRSKIATPDSQNAIRILTIHKSKGLGFKAVIIPFADWETEPKNGTIFWCIPHRPPFDRFHLVPAGYSAELAETIFAEDYYHEKLYACIDNLNALYVAFTRAKEALIIFAPATTARRTKQISRLIRDSITTEGIRTTAEGEPLQSLPEGFRPDDNIFEWGRWWQTRTDSADSPREIPVRHIPSILPGERVRLRLHRNGGFFDDSHRRYGILMHDLLSLIRTTADIPAAVLAKVATGEIRSDETDTLAAQLEQLANGTRTKSWFDGSMHIMNEAEILLGNGRSQRPDRIMIDGDKVTVVDYKFGEQKDARHLQQLKKYVALIRDMGYRTVAGYVWYVETDEMEELSC